MSQHSKSRDKSTVNFGSLTAWCNVDKIICEHTFYYKDSKKVSQKIPHPCANAEQLVH